jgi:uncharacterized membrane protein
MKMREVHCLAAALLFFCGCGSGTDQSPGSTGTCPSDLPGNADCSNAVSSYSSRIASIICSRCLTCHFTGNTISGVSLADQASVHDHRSVVLTQVYHCAMPPAGVEGLASEDRAVLLQYLVCGAPNN